MIYEELKQKALPLIKSYQDDLLKHDKKDIEANPGVPFLHFTGDTGTHLILMPPADSYLPQGEYVPYLFGSAERYHILTDKGKMVKIMPTVNRHDLIIHYDGNKLHVITQAKAEAIIASYIERIQKDWWRTQHETLVR